MKVIAKDLWESGSALDVLSTGNPKDGKLAYKIARIYEASQSESAKLRKIYGVIFREFQNEDGKIPVFSEEAESFEEAITKAFDIEIDIVPGWENFCIDYADIKPDEFPDLKPVHLGKLFKWLIKEP